MIDDMHMIRGNVCDVEADQGRAGVLTQPTLPRVVIRSDADAAHGHISLTVRKTTAGVRNHDYSTTALCRRMDVASALLSQRLGRPPNVSELAAELGVDRGELLDALIAVGAKRPVPIKLADDRQAGDNPDGFCRADVESIGIDDPETLRRLLGVLPEKQRAVIVLRFLESQTQSEIAERVGVSRTEVFQLLLKALAALRQGL